MILHDTGFLLVHQVQAPPSLIPPSPALDVELWDTPVETARQDASGHSCASTISFPLLGDHPIRLPPTISYLQSQICFLPSVGRWTRIWSRRIINPSFLEIWFSFVFLTNLNFFLYSLFFFLLVLLCPFLLSIACKHLIFPGLWTSEFMIPWDRLLTHTLSCSDLICSCCFISHLNGSIA